MVRGFHWVVMRKAFHHSAFSLPAQPGIPGAVREQALGLPYSREFAAALQGCSYTFTAGSSRQISTDLAELPQFWSHRVTCLMPKWCPRPGHSTLSTLSRNSEEKYPGASSSSSLQDKEKVSCSTVFCDNKTFSGRT